MTYRLATEFGLALFDLYRTRYSGKRSRVDSDIKFALEGYSRPGDSELTGVLYVKFDRY